MYSRRKWFAAFAYFLFAAEFCAAQNPVPADQPSANTGQAKPQSICKFDLLMGNHESVRITAVAHDGPDEGVLTDDDCPTKQPVWFELQLKSKSNRNELSKQLKKSGKAAVIVSGELYGPPEPDPKLPDSMREILRKNWAGWGHMGAFPMKLVVFRIESVAPTREPHDE